MDAMIGGGCVEYDEDDEMQAEPSLLILMKCPHCGEPIQVEYGQQETDDEL